MPDHPIQEIDTTGASSELSRSGAGYYKHGRYWIHGDHPSAARFYLDHLLVPHGRRELLRGAVARKVPGISGISLLADNARGSHLSGDEEATGGPGGRRGTPSSLTGIGVESLLVLLEGQLRQAGLEISGPPALLMKEDYPNSERQHTVIFLFDHASPTPVAVAKVTSETSRSAVLEKEFKALTDLHGQLDPWLRLTIPRAIALSEIGGSTVLLETLMPGRSMYFELRNSWRPRRRASGHFRQARRWLTRFQSASHTRVARLGDEVMEEHVMSPLKKVQRYFQLSAAERLLIERTVETAHALRGERLPLVARQGDFWAGNVIVNEGAVGVVDWEHFRERATPFSDLFMFATSYGLSYPSRLGRWAEPAVAFDDTYLKRTWLAELVRGYLLTHCEAMELSCRLLEVFFPVVLAERAVEESPGFTGEHQPPGLKPWRRLFRAYAETGGSVCFG